MTFAAGTRHMKHVNTWGKQVEIITAAILYSVTPIYIASRHMRDRSSYHWRKHSPILADNFMNINTYKTHVELIHVIVIFSSRISEPTISYNEYRSR